VDFKLSTARCMMLIMRFLKIISVISGTGLAAVFINISVENFAGWKFSLTFSIIQRSYFAGFVIYVLINLVLVFSSVYIVTHFAPAAAGSGIPEIKGYLNGKLEISIEFLGIVWV
jgi:chloride channel 7